MNQVKDETDSKKSEFEEDIVHFFCEVCWPDPEKAEVALCGTSLIGHDFAPDAPDESACAMCVEVNFKPCFKCGTVAY